MNNFYFSFWVELNNISHNGLNILIIQIILEKHTIIIFVKKKIIVYFSYFHFLVFVTYTNQNTYIYVFSYIKYSYVILLFVLFFVLKQETFKYFFLTPP